MRRLITSFAVLALLSPLGCLPEESSDPRPARPRADAATPDATGPDAGTLTHDADAPLPDAADPDAALPGADGAVEPDATPIPPSGAACRYPIDCPYGDCVEGACFNDRPTRCTSGRDDECPEGETCGGFQRRFYCLTDCELDEACPRRPRPCRAHSDCPFGTSCHDALCKNDCVTDLDCPSEGHCIDGTCLPFPDDVLVGAPPAPVGQPGQLFAGSAVRPMNYPMGVSMAGFGGRPGPETPYQLALGGSDRVFEALDVRVIAMATDAETLILMRVPLCWSTDYILALTAQKLQALTTDAEHPDGINYDGKIITSAPHSHSEPGRFWNLVPNTGFGIFGHGTFSKEMTERYTDSFALTIKAALDDLRPARVGWTLLDAFDPDSRIHSDRRGESPEFKDDRMLVLRFEDLDGTPIGGVVNYATHGTHMEYPWLTGDAAGGVEVALTERLSAASGAPVPVMFFNGNAGDISPRGDDGTSVDWGKMQAVGHRVWAPFERAWQAATPRADVRLEVVTRRIPVTYEGMGYDLSVPDFRAPDGRPQIYGAFQCVADSLGAEAPPYMDPLLGCRLNIETFIHTPIVQQHKTTLTAFRLDVCPARGADCDTGPLVVVTLPGESTSRLGVHLSEMIEADADAAGEPDTRVMNFGYSQNHHLYLLEEDDWRRGGYEAAQNLWGWKFGAFIQESSRALATQLFTAEREDNDTGIKPTWWPNLTDDTVAPTETTGTPGATVMAPPASVQRGALVEVRWTGGHPGVDQPTVWLEREGGGGFEPVMRPGGLPFDHGGFESLTIYAGDYQADHTWGGRWELPFDLPVGTYRLSAEGHHQRGGVATPYRFDSAAFEITPATLVLREATVAAGRIAVKINYPNGPTNDDGVSPFDALEVRGHWLRWDGELSFPDPLRRWSFVLGGPLPLAQVEVTVGDATPTMTDVQPDQVAVDLMTSRPAGGAPGITHLEGWVTTRVEVDAPPEPGRYPVTVRDAFGNEGTVMVEVVGG